MQNPQLQNQSTQHHAYDEDILVVSTQLLFQNNLAWYGINPDVKTYTDLIKAHSSFIPRAHAETNQNYKQIIPYIIFLFEDKIFVMQRKQTASEQRLAGKLSIGIGGHIREEDITSSDITSWALREFQEEVTFTGLHTVQQLGVLNDDSSDVGKVHLGVILLFRGNSNQISINDEHKSGILLTRDECLALKSSMESWSQICLDFLIEHKLI
jgi:predicted NUDIX family phosphoesterase